MKCVKPPSLRRPSSICSTPASATARKNNATESSCWIVATQIAVRPAAGPLTLSSDRLISEMTIPPTMPEMRPDTTDVPEANEMPRQSGKATKKTVMLARKSWRKNERTVKATLRWGMG